MTAKEFLFFMNGILLSSDTKTLNERKTRAIKINLQAALQAEGILPVGDEDDEETESGDQDQMDFHAAYA